jgi:hypothetical protein
MPFLPHKGAFAVAAVIDIALNARERPVAAKALTATALTDVVGQEPDQFAIEVAPLEGRLLHAGHRSAAADLRAPVSRRDCRSA